MSSPSNSWLIKHLEFAQRADDKEEMILRIQAVIDRINVLDSKDLPDLICKNDDYSWGDSERHYIK